MPIRFRAAAFALASLALVGGCRDASGPDREPVDPNEGTVAFTFSGDTAGTFSARGVPPTGAPYADSYTRAFVEPTNGYTYVSGYVGPGRGERLVLTLAEITGPGTVAACTQVPTLEESCFMATLQLGWDPAAPQGARMYETESGSLTITEWGPGRLRGTFTATVRRGSFFGGGIVLGNGTFDLPMPAAPAS